MEIRKAYLEIAKAMPGGWDALSAALGMTRSALENRVYERKGQGILVDTALQMQAFVGGTQFAQAVAVESGGTFVKLPVDLSDQNESIGKKFRELSVRFGELAKRYDEATEDGEIDLRERADLEAIGAGIHRVVEEVLALSFRVHCRQPAEVRNEG